jgi:uncharacterized protein with von Willebrand factor type A (vWA) domain
MNELSPPLPCDDGDDGKLVDNILFFARVLRAAGLPVGPGTVIEAVHAVETVGITDREVFYWALHTVFVNRRDQREIFDQAFHIFWRNPRLLERMMQMVLPTFRTGEAPEKENQLNRRVADALTQSDGGEGEAGEDQDEQEIQFDATMTYSGAEVLQSMDFEKMSAEEIAQAKTAISRMRLPIMDVPTRRFRPSTQGGRVDPRASLRASLRGGGDTIPIKLKTPRRRPPPLVTLCDISGSMNRYSRMLLHFMHTLTNDRSRVHTFLFGTRLTNVTRYLRHKDVDEALDMASAAVEDWSGGTRIGQCLHSFNRYWSRRVLGQGAIVLLISDGLDRDAGEGLAEEVERLHGSCRRLIWLNPLLRFDGFAPKSLGVRAILPHVDEFRSVHSLGSLKELADALGSQGGIYTSAMSGWKAKLHTVEMAELALGEGS